MTRKWADKGRLYSTAQWTALRIRILQRDNHTCQMCGAMLKGGKSDQGDSILRPAVVDHLIPHKGDRKLFFASANLWATCCDCHDGPCQMIEARKGIAPAAIRAAKLAHRVPSLDGTSRRPLNRWVDQQYPQERLMIW